MSIAVYTRYELLRAIRNRRVIVFALAFPVILYLAIAAPNRNVADFSGTGISLPLYFMVGLAAFATMNAMLASGGRITADRAAGWNRQLRVTPLSPYAYIGTKVLTGYLLAGCSIIVLYACGAALGVSLPAGRWLEMTALLLIGLIPFAALGLALGHLLSPTRSGRPWAAWSAYWRYLAGAGSRSAATASFTTLPRRSPLTGSSKPATWALGKLAGAYTAGW